MATIVRLTHADTKRRPVYVNLDQARFFDQTGSDSVTTIVFSGDEKYRVITVIETPDEIHAMSRNA